MKISCNILKKHIKNSEDINWLSVWDKFTIRTAEVEGVEVKGANLDGVVVAEIKSVENHPESKKLHILRVDSGEEELQIVCGAPNVRVGLKSALVKIGGHIDGFEISKRPLVGIDSYGMMCSKRELGISEEHEGIIELPNDYVVGKDIKEYIPIDDIIVEIDNKSLTNRPDLWGHYGIAREIAAITNHELLPLELIDIPKNNKNLNIKIENPDLCYRYLGLKLGNIENKETPLWLETFLNYAGMRSLNNLIVDLTNYIMLELGTPMHAFDERVVKDIEIGLAKENDIFTTLDKVERNLTHNNLMIKNDGKYFAIAGVMGGLDSEILSDTTGILLESACFEASSIRKTATSLGLRTEASARYEKSLDPNMSETATKRFVKILSDYNPNITYLSNLTDVYPTKLNEIKVTLTKELLNKYMGFNLDSKIVIDILTSLDFKVKELMESYEVTVPTYRATKDISNGADLIEEIARIYGYENFEHVPLVQTLSFENLDSYYDKEYEIKEYLAEKYSLNEIHTYLWYETSFLKELGIEKENVSLLGKKEDNILRDDLNLSLLKIAQNNLKNYNRFNIFEIGTCIVNNENNKQLSIMLVDDANNIETLYNKGKEIVNAIIRTFKNKKVLLESTETKDYYNKDLAKNIIVDNEVIGTINVFKRNITNVINKKKCFVAINIDFDKYVKIEKEDIFYKEISKYPLVELDYTLIVEKNSKYADLNKVLKEFVSPIIKSHKLLGIYENDEEKKISIRYIVGSNEKTLDGEELHNFKTAFINHIKSNGLNIIE